jgi:hypothetical protein
MEALQVLQAEVGHEIQFCAKSIKKELTKVATDKADLKKVHTEVL